MSKSVLLALALSNLASTVIAAPYISYSTVTGYFLQDEATTDPGTFDFTANNFGLIDQTYDTDAVFNAAGDKTLWQRFENKVEVLNAEAGPNAQYKVLYLGRHGEGYHNAAETFYGTPAWNCYWSELDGNATVRWADAEITPNGVQQAQVAHNFWASQLTTQKQSLPQSYYTSPLTRCLHTAAITFDGLVTPFSPLVKELFREGISMHTCDRRSNRTYIHDSYPGYRIEAGLTEFDELWKGFEAETSDAQDKRSKTVVDQVFSSDASTFLSVTSHSGEIGSILRIFGHQSFSLVTGAVIPVLVKAETLASGPATTAIQSWTAQATCTVPPITSLATGGCVCPSASSTSASITSTSSIPVTTTSATVSPTSSASSSHTYGNGTATSTPYGSGSVSTHTPYGSGAVSSSSSPSLTTSVVCTTKTSTITACPATITDCSVGSVTTIVETLYTTTCPIKPTPSTTGPSLATSMIYTTTLSTITACPSTIADCTVGSVTTKTIPVYATSISPAASSPASSQESSPTLPSAPYVVSNGTVPAGPSTAPSASASSGTGVAVGPTASFAASGGSHSLAERIRGGAFGSLLVAALLGTVMLF